MRSSDVEQRVDPVEARAPGRPRSRAGSSWWPRIRPSRVVDRDVDARRAEVGDEDVAGVGPERQLARRPAAGARPDVALDDEPALDQLADALGDDGPPQPVRVDQLGARARRPRRISSSTVTSASSASSGSGP